MLRGVSVVFGHKLMDKLKFKLDGAKLKVKGSTKVNKIYYLETMNVWTTFFFVPGQ